SCGIGEKTYWENERPAFTAWQVGEAVIWLILKGEEVGRAAMAEYLEKKRREVGNTIYKGVLCEAANW
ncbi:TPA: hypothetical protein ACWSWD_005473, partial [Klebsiella pneumoniae]